MIAETFLQDVRIGLRVLVKDRGFAAASVSVLALGICAVATMFTAVDATILRGFSFPNGDRLMDVAFIDPTTRSPSGVNNRIHAMDFEQFRTEQKSFERMAAYLSERKSFLRRLLVFREDVSADQAAVAKRLG